jgi:hypothetical protein
MTNKADYKFLTSANGRRKASFVDILTLKDAEITHDRGVKFSLPSQKSMNSGQ